MTTANPFAGKFKVDLDPDDYQPVSVSSNKTNEQLFSNKEQESKKKKKVRPEKKDNDTKPQVQDDEGFEVVSKHKQPKKKHKKTV